MSNYIKYSTNTQTLALKSGNYYIGTGDVRKGPTSTTDYWSCIIPPTSGYTVYLNKASNGPSIYTCNNDTDLINITNRIASQSYTSVTQCLVYYLGQNDKLCANIDYPSIVTNGLVLNLDAGFVPSYPRSGTTWHDLTSNTNNGTLINGPTFSLSYSGAIVFDGVDDVVNVSTAATLNAISTAITINVWFTGPTLTGIDYKGVIMRSTDDNWSDGFGIFYERILTNNRYVFYINNWETNRVIYPITSQQTTPLLLTGTYSTSTGLILYVNGSQYGSASYSTSINNPASALLKIGGATSNYYHSGNIYYASIYNRALTATEVLQNYNATKSRFGL
jgi:hypothetical protein